LSLALDKLSVNFGVEISKIVPGYVSTEVDAALSFDAAGSAARGRRLIALYEASGVPRARVLVKLASTWEGIEAARALEAEGIACNLTLLFCFAQAAAAAAAGATLISPFVGRITDWHKAKRGVADIPVEEDPGVTSVRAIYAYYKRHGIKTIVMGASFRSTAQVCALAGCDRLTIAPALIEKLAAGAERVPPVLTPEYAATAAGVPAARVALSEADFRWQLNQDAMATEKLAEGIRAFSADLRSLEAIIGPLLEA
jgi:transaldolase